MPVTAVEALTILAVLVLAFGLRVFQFDAVPSLTDETNEAMLALEIARGEAMPLTNVATYLSPFFNYLLAAGFKLIGPWPHLPRLVALVAGVLTMVPTYLLARDLARASLGAHRSPLSAQLAGALAAALLATNGAHALVSSRIAWGHALTPLVATAGLWLLHRALWRGGLAQLAGAAACLALAVQSHTTALALVPGFVLSIALARPRWLLDRRVLFGGMVTLAMSVISLIAHNLAGAGGSFAAARAASDAYTRGAAPGLDLYAGNLARLGLAEARILAGAVDVRADGMAYLADPLVWLAIAVAALGSALAIRRGCPVVLVALPYALLLAYFNAKYQIVPNSRFLAPIAPLGFAAIAIGTVFIATRRSGRARLVGASLAGAVALIFVLGAHGSLQTRLQQLEPSAIGSQQIEAAVAALLEERDDEPVALDPDLEKLWLDGGGDYRRALRFHLSARGIAAPDLETRPRKEQGAINSCRRNQVELRYVDPSATPDAPRLLTDDPGTADDESVRAYWLFRTVQPRDRQRDARRGQADEWRVIVASYAPPLGGSARAVDRCAPGLPI